MFNPTKYKDFGLLILRLGIGGSFVVHGFPKLIAGPKKWAWLGGNMKNVGIDFAPEFWGFMAAFSECVGGLCVAIGFFTPIASLLLFITMMIATLMHLKQGDPFKVYSHALESGIIFFALIFIGSGKYALKCKL